MQTTKYCQFNNNNNNNNNHHHYTLFNNVPNTFVLMVAMVVQIILLGKPTDSMVRIKFRATMHIRQALTSQSHLDIVFNCITYHTSMTPTPVASNTLHTHYFYIYHICLQFYWATTASFYQMKYIKNTDK